MEGLSVEADRAPDVSIRRMRLADVKAVAALEKASFTTPWQPSTFQSLLERPSAELWVVDDPADGVVGYAVVWCILDQGEIANIAVDEAHRGRGLGARLLGEMLDVAGRRGVRAMYLEVRVSNAAARRLYERFDFREVGRRTDYYEAPREDALVLLRRL